MTTKAETGKSVWVGGVVCVRSADHIVDGALNKGAVNVTFEKLILGESGVAGGVACCHTNGKNIVNEAPITVTANNAKSLSVAGALSYQSSKTYIFSENCFNSGAITVTGVMHNTTTTAYGLFVAGISARTLNCLRWDRTDGDWDSFTANSGNINIDVDCTSTGPVYGYVGGISASNQGACIGGVNRGDITVAGDDYTLYYMGGIVGRKYNQNTSSYGVVPVENCQNHGDITSSVTCLKSDQYWSFGGIIGQLENGSTSKTAPTSSVTKVMNTGSITVGTSKTNLSVGGLVGFNYAPLEGFEIPESAAINITGEHVILRVGAAMGSCAGTATTGCPVPTLKSVTNNAPITLTDVTATGSVKNAANVTSSIMVGGLVGFHNMTRNYVSIHNSRNKGAITISNATTAAGITVGGLAGIIHSAVGTLNTNLDTASYNEANINISGKSGSFLYAAGIVGAQTNGDADGGSYCFNSGAVTADVECTAEYSLGGIGGIHLGMTKYSHNSGALTAKGKTEGRCFVGGIIARKNSSRFSGYNTNEGKITASVDAALVLAVGGLSGFSNNVSWDYDGNANSGDIEIPRDATCRGDVAVGGCTGWQFAGSGSNPVATFDFWSGKAPLSNTGRIVVAGSSDHDTFVGGIHGIFVREGTCPVTVDGVTTDVPCSAGCYVADVVYDTDGTTALSKTPAAVSHTNTGDIRFAGSTVNAYVGGVVGLQDSQVTGNSTSTVTPACNGTVTGEENVGEVAGLCAPADYLPFFRLPTE